jgi:hypothetical protein
MAPTPSRADPLDQVLDVLNTAGVIDGNVKAAKPLIQCMAKGGNAVSCAKGNAGDTELANDPQVQNVLDIYQSVQQQDWYAVLKKAGVTAGCALIPEGGEVKDAVCGELGKIAMQVLDGVGSVLGAVGGFVNSLAGGDSSPAISDQDYYTLNFMPWYHKSVIYQLDYDTPSNTQILNYPMKDCVSYFLKHTLNGQLAVTKCSDMQKQLSDRGYAIGNTFRQETDSYYQLHFAPKMEEWAQIAFVHNEQISGLAASAKTSCIYNERKKLPLPSPGFEQCEAMKQAFGNLPAVFSGMQDALNQCQTVATLRSVPSDNDAYTRICEPVEKRVQVAILGAMGQIKSLMDTAAAAGCPNDGTPKSIHCDSGEAHTACVNAIPEHASMCQLTSQAILDTAAAAGCPNNGTVQSIHCDSDTAWAACVQAMPEQKALCQIDFIMAARANAQLIFESATTADSPCELNDRTISCIRPIQQKRCQSTWQAISDAWGPTNLIGVHCTSLDNPVYDQLMQQAQSAVAALNATYPPNPPPTEGCTVWGDDPLVISCPDGFQWDAIPERAEATYNLLHTTDSTGRPGPIFCVGDVDHDGAEAPCLAGEELPALPPPAMVPQPPQGLQQLQPVNPARPVQQTPATRMRRALPIIKRDGSGGG